MTKGLKSSRARPTTARQTAKRTTTARSTRQAQGPRQGVGHARTIAQCEYVSCRRANPGTASHPPRSAGDCRRAPGRVSGKRKATAAAQRCFPADQRRFLVIMITAVRSRGHRNGERQHRDAYILRSHGAASAVRFICRIVGRANDAAERLANP